MTESFFDRVHKQDTHTPDVLSCLANLSNDEVFTSPEVVNQMLDLLPQELFTNPDTTFLDPATKTGVFLREIAKRLIIGLEPVFPDLQTRIDHIFHNQLFGIAITELTSLLARRSLYCSKYPNGKYSISHFDNPEGNIIFKKIRHTWKDGRCIYCGARQSEYDRQDNLETHAYQFIHNPKELEKMHFDVIIGNPPYQLSDGGGTGSSAISIYQKFVMQAEKLNPRYLTMIIPSRWFTGGKGLDEFRKYMITNKKIKILHDYMDATQCFPGVSIEGGVCYFLRDAKYDGKCTIYTHNSKDMTTVSTRFLADEGIDIFIRDNMVLTIVKKVLNCKKESFSKLVFPRNYFGASNGMSFDLTSSKDSIKILGRFNGKRDIRYVDKKRVIKGTDLVDNYKIFVSKADGAAGQIGNPIPARIIGKSEIGEKQQICTETFLAIGPFQTKEEMLNVYEYMKTKFFRFMVGARKNKNMTQDTYKYVPILPFNKKWTDTELYKEFGLTKSEIDYIETMISEYMEVASDVD